MEEKQDYLQKHIGISWPQVKNALPIILAYAFFAWLIWGIVVKPLVGRFWGVPEIGHIFEKSTPYDTDYYVNLFPENSDAKNYRLIGNITVSEADCYDDGDSTECYPGPIYLNSVTWPNGGSSYFEDCAFEQDRRSLCWDNEDREWRVELTKERVKKP